MNYYKANTPAIALEYFDNEIIIVNLEKGNYYSLRHTAFDLWNLLIAGHTAASASESIAARYTLGSGDVLSVVEPFVNQLVEENLLTELSEVADTLSDSAVFIHPTFELPVLEVFTDMQELLLLDPIHEVKPQEQGWPFKK